MAPRTTFVKLAGDEMGAMTPLQLRMARAALKLGVRELAAAGGISPTTVTRFEAGRGGVNSGTLAKLEAALEERGIVFVTADDTGEATVRLRRTRT